MNRQQITNNQAYTRRCMCRTELHRQTLTHNVKLRSCDRKHDGA